MNFLCLIALFFCSQASFELFATSTSISSSSTKHNTKLLKFGGGGIFFWWQAGCLKYMQECQFNPQTIPIMGTSAGSLAATLLVSGGDIQKAAEFAIFQAMRDGLLESSPSNSDNYIPQKKKSLAGIWGGMLDEWLDEILPTSIPQQQLSKLYITVTPANLLRGPKQIILCNFQDKSDVKQACLASCHIPLFLNTKFTARYQQKRYIDGSFWTFVKVAKPVFPPELSIQDRDSEVFWIHWQNDKKFCEQVKGLSFTSLITPQGLYEMMDAGYEWMREEHASGRTAAFL